MIRTVFSSFLFLLPVYVSHKRDDTFHLMIFTMAMGISIANHAHTFHKDQTRRNLFCGIDCCFMAILGVYLFVNALYRNTVDPRLAFALTALNIAIYRQMDFKYIESYSESQRCWHVVFHMSAITTMTVLLYGVSSIEMLYTA